MSGASTFQALIDREDDDDHGDGAGGWDAGCADGGQGRGDDHDEQLGEAEIDPPELEEEDDGDGFVERGAVHVDGGPQGQDKIGGPLGAPALALGAFKRDRKRGRAGVGAEGGHQGPPHLQHVPIRVLAREQQEYQRQHDESVNGQSRQHYRNVFRKGADQLSKANLADRPRDEQEDPSRGEPNDPQNQFHNGGEKTFKQPYHRFGCVTARR